MTISVIGLGFVGTAIYESFKQKNVNVIGYDKYKNGGFGSLKNCLKTDIIFLCLPTQFSYETHEYDKSAIIEVLTYITDHKYNGLIVLKSTVGKPSSSAIV